MTDTTTLDVAGSQDAVEKPRRSGALTTMKVAELQGLAASMGISGTAKMRKGDLVTAIKARQSGTSVAGSTSTSSSAERPAERQTEQSAERSPERRQERQERQQERQQEQSAERQAARSNERQDSRDGGQRDQPNRGGQRDQQNRGDQRDEQNRDGGQRDQNRGDQNRDGQRDQQNRGDQQNRNDPNRNDQNNNDDDGDGRGGRRRNRNRSRNRDKRPGRGGRDFGGDYENEPQVTDDDVLIPVAGILDVLENYAFVRTSGYLPGANDVYVPLGLVKKNGMRKGDAVTGAVRAQRDDQQQQVQRQKFNALVRLDTINGM
ncbi:MAG TPA: Rho termination factor N-terminal domain-containing protein, partial [Pedococcus sp.]|nr:Rho termination factor N-terminal domain-containing protein [Pedococcus sp.]